MKEEEDVAEKENPLKMQEELMGLGRQLGRLARHLDIYNPQEKENIDIGLADELGDMESVYKDWSQKVFKEACFQENLLANGQDDNSDVVVRWKKSNKPIGFHKTNMQRVTGSKY